jgi:hypothetical protein
MLACMRACTVVTPPSVHMAHSALHCTDYSISSNEHYDAMQMYKSDVRTDCVLSVPCSLALRRSSAAMSDTPPSCLARCDECLSAVSEKSTGSRHVINASLVTNASFVANASVLFAYPDAAAVLVLFVVARAIAAASNCRSHGAQE